MKVTYKDLVDEGKTVTQKTLNERHGVPKSDDEVQAEALAKFSTRFSEMCGARTVHERDWDICDGQMEANTFYDNGVLQVNMPLERDLVETATGRFSGKLNFKLEPIGHEPVVEDQQASKHILSHYIWSEKMHKEIANWRRDKAVYGTAIYFSGIVAETRKSFEIKEDADIEAGNALRNNDNYHEKIEENYYFTGHNVPLRSFWMDDKAMHRKDFDGKHHEAEDCIMKVTMSMERFQDQYGENPYFINQKDVSTGADANPDYNEHKSALADDEVILYHYFNKMTKDYWIVANESVMVFMGKMLNKSGDLPFAIAQHYTDTKSLYGWGICRKVRYLKAYKAEMLQDMLNQSKMGGHMMVVGNNGELSGDYYNDPSEVNIIHYTSSVEDIKPLQFQPDIGKYQAIIQLLDDLAIQDTGENIRASYQPVADQLGTVEIIENNRMVRIATVDENDDNGLCDILTECLHNLQQFAPALQKKIEKAMVDGEEVIQKEIYPLIRVPGMKVLEEDGAMNFIEDEGEEGYFEFRPELTKAKYNVKVVTNSNVQVMNTLEKNSMTQYITNLMTIAQLRPDLVQGEDIEGLKNMMKQLYGYDDKYMTETKRGKLKREFNEKLSGINDMLGLSNPTNDQDPTQDPTATPGDQAGGAGAIQSSPGTQGASTGVSPSQIGDMTKGGKIPGTRETNGGALV